MSIFQKSVISSRLSQLENEQIDKAFKKFKENYSQSKIAKIQKMKEEEYQDGFLRDIFVDVLDYTLKPADNYNLAREFKNQTDGKKADGAILKNGSAIAVIELKSTKTKDLTKVTEQAFNYKNNQPECKYVITSNFHKLRFYIDYANEYEEFDLFNLQKNDFQLLYLLLHKESILSDLPLTLKSETKFHEENISDKLYKDYSAFKYKIYDNLIKNNPQYDKLTLFKKSQKFLDRLLFVFFAEDTGLVPPNAISKIVEQWQQLQDLDEYFSLYSRFVKFFGHLDKGHKYKTYDLPAYNGGLFAPDEILDNVTIDDEILKDDALLLSAYDYSTEVDVNILGHIFEHSLNEIEEITAEIEGTATDKSKTKRKKDGVFYTPKYITQYIVENTIGKLCTEKRAELGISEIEFDESIITKTGKMSAKGKKLFTTLQAYKEWLFNLKVIDPACGSGAFLNQALNFLINEHAQIDDITAELTGESLRLFDTDKTILEKNLYGVDINEESVEIAKLSLWLRTAQKGRKLSNLNNNIKCGNSLIDDPEVAGEKAFNWQNEFPQIFRRKKKKAWHITTATHNSRYSQRMFDNYVKLGEAEWLDDKDSIIVTVTVRDIALEDNLNVVEYNVCGDHLHMLLVCEEEELTKIVGKIKSVTAKIRNRKRGYTTATDAGTRACPLSDTNDEVETDRRGKTQHSLWKQKFRKSEIKDDEYLSNRINYIRNNRKKHELPEIKEIEKLKKEFLYNAEHAMREEYSGGFDVVIGNPPYVRAELLTTSIEYLKKGYKVFNPSADLFSYFYEKSFNILKKDTGLFGFISNTFDKTTAGITLREYLKNNIVIEKYIDFTEVQIFEGATTYPVIITAINKLRKNESFDYIKIPKASQSKTIDINSHSIVDVEQSSLDGNSWSFKSKRAVLLIEKLKKNNTVKDIYGKCYRGLLTGLNDAFIIPKAFTPNEHVKPIYEGKELSKWIAPECQQQLILFQSKWTRLTYGESIEEAEALYKLQEDYPELICQILNFEDRAKKRYDKGEFFWELRNCAYYNLFEVPKIVFPNLQNSNKFAYDKTGAYINAPAVILPTEGEFLTALLNSKLVWYFLTNICVVRSGGYIEVKPQYFEQIPIPELSDKAKDDLSILTQKNINATKALQEKSTRFLNRIQSNLEVAKISKKLEQFYDYDFKTFVAELKKQKVKLSLVQQDEWENYFNAYKSEINALQTQIATTDKEIDQMVYELYGLSDEEIAIVENV